MAIGSTAKQGAEPCPARDMSLFSLATDERRIIAGRKTRVDGSNGRENLVGMYTFQCLPWQRYLSSAEGYIH